MSEVLRNIKGSWVRSIALVSFFLVAGVGVSVFTSEDTTRIAAVHATQYSAGADVYEVIGPSGDRVDALECHSLSWTDGVVSAGGIMSNETISLGAQPNAQVRLAFATPGYIRAAWPDLATAQPVSLLAGPALLDIGIGSGQSIEILHQTRNAEVLEVDVAALTPSVLGDERILLASSPPRGTVPSCLVLVEPSARSAVGAALTDTFGAGTSVRAVLLRTELISDPETLLANRQSQLGWLTIGLACTVVLLGTWLARRHELALYRLLGFGESAVLGLLATEAALVAVIPSQLGIMIGAAYYDLSKIAADALLVDVIRFDAVLIASPALAFILLPRSSLVSALLGK